MLHILTCVKYVTKTGFNINITEGKNLTEKR